MANYEARRLKNIRRNEALVKGLGMRNDLAVELQNNSNTKNKNKDSGSRANKRRKVQPVQPTRASARIANSPSKPTYTENDVLTTQANKTRQLSSKGRSTPSKKSSLGKANSLSDITSALTPSSSDVSQEEDEEEEADEDPSSQLATLRASWTSWTPVAPPPTLVTPEESSSSSTPVVGSYYHFDSHPHFRPNKSPESIIREGAFGGTYYRPLYSSKLRTTIRDDWIQDLPPDWIRGLDTSRYLTSTEYDPEINKYGVQCGQSIEAWEANGWINHEYDVRGWFQWYCRFWRGRRSEEEDDRQVARWKKCVGEKGRWRRILLKKYVKLGIRSVTDEGEEEDGGGEERPDVSPVVHQTCHHWAWEVRQDVLDQFWEEEEGGGS